MDDAVLVRDLERVGDLPRDVTHFIERNRTLCDPIRQRRALDELHHQPADSVGLLQSVDGGDVRVVQRCEQERFAL